MAVKNSRFDVDRRPFQMNFSYASCFVGSWIHDFQRAKPGALLVIYIFSTCLFLAGYQLNADSIMLKVP